jgi:hypothetical protein
MRFKPSHRASKLERRCKCTGGSLLDTAGIRFNSLFPIYQGFGRTIDGIGTDNPTISLTFPTRQPHLFVMVANDGSEDSHVLHLNSLQLHDLTVDTEE